MKKLISFALVLMLVLSLSTAAFAVQDKTNGETRTDGSITVEGVVAAHTYSLYKLLHLHTYNENTGAYTYVVEEAWDDFFAQETINGVYVNVDESKYVTWNGNADVVAFAQEALAYAQANNIGADASQTATSNGTLDFTGLTLGYYLMDTSMGALCGLDTTVPHAVIELKNEVPTLVKGVEEDTQLDVYGNANTADMGQVVKFQATIQVKQGAQNYVYHDKMDAGLTFNADSVTVKYNGNAMTENTDYQVVTHAADACDAEWDCTFAVEFLGNLNVGTITIEYSATLNENAEVGPEGNKNAAILVYGDNHKTTISETITYTYGFEIYKTDSDETNPTPLTGAEFQLLHGGQVVNLVKVSDDLYRVAGEGETGTTDTIVVANANGLVKVVGLDKDTYELRETKAPDGYRVMAGTRSFTIDASNLYSTNENGVFNVGAAIHIKNNKGALLPETGGLGTVLFTVLGGSTALGTGVVLVTKKRMSKIEDEE